MAFCDYDKIVLFGDSITEQSYEQTRGFGFGAALSDVYRRKLEVVQKGFSGYNTGHALWILPQIIPEPSEASRIELMTVFFGANDAVLPELPQYIPLAEYRSHLKKIFKHDVLKPHNPKFILITPPPICEYATQAADAEKGKNFVQRLAARTKMYADAAVEVGKELGVPTVNLWKACIDYAGGWKEGEPIPGSKPNGRNEKLTGLFRDGLHFSPIGYELMYNEVLKTICTSYPELDPQHLEFVFPCWEECPKAGDDEEKGDTCA